MAKPAPPSPMTSSAPHVKQSPPLPPLPRWELRLYWAVWLGHAIYAWYLVWVASGRLESRLYSGFFEPTAGGSGWRSLLVGDRKRDVSNFEWCSYFAFLPVELITFAIHSIAFRIIERQQSLDRSRRDNVYMVIWTALLWIKLGWIGVVTMIIQAIVMLTIAWFTRSKLAVWLCACCLLATLASDQYPLKDDLDLRYRFSVYVAYKLLHFISFCAYHIDTRTTKGVTADSGEEIIQQTFLAAYRSMLHYTLYPPYSGTLIVCYHDFLKQWRGRSACSAAASIPKFVIVRFVIWTLVNDLMLHFIYNNAMMMDPYLLTEVDLPTLCAIGYTAGQYFYMKYVSIFGLNTIFALLDGMTPPKWPPICISRVALYSNMWRHFDRGLYAFLRGHIFIPIAQPNFGFMSRTFATLVCFAFIWLWHGMSWGYLYWVGLNFIEVMLENITKQVYRNSASTRRFLSSAFSPVNLRRVRAFTHVVCTALGIFSIFYFLGGVYVGHVFTQRLVINEGLFLNTPLFYLVLLGYCFAQVCMDAEARVQ